MTELGRAVRERIESYGGVPALDDKTMGMLSALNCARNFVYFSNARDAFARNRLSGGG